MGVHGVTSESSQQCRECRPSRIKRLPRNMNEQERLSAVDLSPSRVRALQRKLLRWYSENRRDLPWRKVKDPYAVWISEVMLQQTQVQTVIPYYLRFLLHYRDIGALANAETEQLLRLWEGLGYYSRARNLHKAARVVVERFGGEFPKSYEDVLALPGIGRYTAAAILSIAFDQPYAVVDGNVARVLARVLRIEGDVRHRQVQQSLWAAAQRLLPSRNPGDFNQATMELGATVCSPRQPSCSLCPWQADCLARREGLQETLPVKRKRPAVRKSTQAAIVIHHRGRYFIVRRSGQRVLQDFWEFPGAELRQTENLNNILVRWIQRTYGLSVDDLERFMTLKHAITVRRIELRVFHCELAPNSPSAIKRQDCRWMRLRDMDRYPFASASRRVLEALRKHTESHIKT
jgi:A/G-specific adenine glycosylase